jgi:hypothetical protein
MISCRSLQLFLAALSLVAWLAQAYRIDVTGPMASYDYIGYRPVPNYMVGMFSRTSALSYASGTQDTSPTVTISVDISGTASASAQAFVYNADIVERIVWREVPGAHPCMDVGQSSGVGITPNMSDNAFGVSAGMLMVGEPFYTIRERLYLKDTGLYIVAFNVCRYKNVTFQTANGTWLTRRQLDVTGWRDMRLTGFVDFENPFGFLPGQSYGFLPTYIALFVLSLLVLLIYSIMAFRVGRERMLRYQWVMLGLSALSVAAYFFLMTYYGHLNRTNVDSYGLFIAGSLLVILRNTVGALATFLMCYGWGVCYRSVGQAAAFSSLSIFVVRLGANLCEFLMSQTLFSVRTGVSGTSSSEDTTTAWKVLRVLGILLDVVIAAACALALRRCMAALALQGMRSKMIIYRRTAISLAVGSLLALGWAGVMIHKSTAPLMTFGEAQWEVAWLPDAVWELLYFSIFSTIVMVWLPFTSSFYQFYGEEIPSGTPVEPETASRNRHSRKKAQSIPKPSKPSPVVTPSASGREGLVVVSTGESAAIERKPRPATVCRVAAERVASETDGVELEAL